MTIHFLNCFTCNARIPSSLRTGTLCLLIESTDGLILVDTGPGQADYARPPAILRLFQLVTIVPMKAEESAVRQLPTLGFRPADVHHIVLTHMHFDHCGGLPDFPWATVHVHRREYEAFTGRPQRWTDIAYVRQHAAHHPNLALYEDSGGKWFDLDAIRLPLDPEMWLVPLFGHTRGHCGLAIQTGNGWLFHVADAASLEYSVPGFIERAVLGEHGPRLRLFKSAHPEIRMTTGHMPLEWFAETAGLAATEGA